MNPARRAVVYSIADRSGESVSPFCTACVPFDNRGTTMPTANWKTQVYGRIMSLLYNNPHRVVQYRVRDAHGNWVDRGSTPAPVRRLFETEGPDERTCLQTIQFVHHVLIPPQGRHVEELHIHPDAEELVVITTGHGVMDLEGITHDVSTGDVVYIPPSAEHELRNEDPDELLGALFINVPTGAAIPNLVAAQQQALSETTDRPA